jgi:cell division protein FtsB
LPEESVYDSVMSMRMRRRLSENLALMIVPAVCGAISFYFVYSGVFGERGVMALRSTQDQLAIARRDLATLRAEREALQHRISLLDGKTIDPDLLDEVARGQLLESGPGEVTLPREKP